MATIEKTVNKAGEIIYKVSVSNGRGRRVKRSWKPEPTWSAKTTQRELAKFAAQLENALASGELLTRQEQQAQAASEAAERAKLKTFQQYVDGVFLSAKALSLTANAVSNYHQMINKHLFPALGDCLMTEISPAMLQKLLLAFQGQGYSHATCVKLYIILNGIFEMAFRDDTIQANPMLKVDRPKPTKDEKSRVQEHRQAYSVEEVQYIFSCLRNEPLQWRCYITLSVDGGFRRGELCGLQWKDIDFQSSLVTVRHNLQYTAETGVYLATPKSGRTRQVDIGPESLSLLQQLRKQQSESCISTFVFSQHGSTEPMHPQTPTRYFKKFGQRYNVPDFHPHRLRHTAATLMLLNGADMTSVAQRLGHAAVSTTVNFYSHANAESVRRAGEAARAALKEAK